MKKGYGIAIAFLLTGMYLVAAPGASAATEFGDNCAANDDAEAPVTLFELAGAGNPLPTAAPSAGVITKWKVNVIPVPVSIPQTLKVLRPNTSAKTVQVIGEASGTANGGPNTFDTRISVQAGDRLGLFEATSFGPLLCELPGASIIGAFEGGSGIGATVPFVEIPTEVRIPVSAVIEPDADNDGYGDETQDKCPQVASVQAECPVVTIDLSSAIKKKSSVTVLLTTSSEAPVKVSGTVKLGKGQKAKLSGKTQKVKPGKIARFTLKFPKKLNDKLGDLTTKQSLQLKVTATATDLIGRVSQDSLTVKLKGQARS
jgi:hypothetical protein